MKRFLPKKYLNRLIRSDLVIQKN